MFTKVANVFLTDTTKVAMGRRWRRPQDEKTAGEGVHRAKVVARQRMSPARKEEE